MNAKFLLGTVIILVALSAIFLYVSGTKKSQTPKAVPTLIPSPTEVIVKVKEVEMGEQNKSGQKGTAVFREENGKTTVSINISEGVFGKVAQPAHIHLGTCSKLGAIKYPLENVIDGKSETVIDKSLDALLSELPLVINVHKSAKQSKIYVSCGDLEVVSTTATPTK